MPKTYERFLKNRQIENGIFRPGDLIYFIHGNNQYSSQHIFELKKLLVIDIEPRCGADRLIVCIKYQYEAFSVEPSDCFHSRNEAIDALIAHLKRIKEGD